MSENEMVAVLFKEKPADQWNFICYCIDAYCGWQFAAVVQQHERFVSFQKRAKAIVVKRSNYDLGKIREYKPPKKWKPNLLPDKEVYEYAKKITAEEEAEQKERQHLEAEFKRREKEERCKARESKKDLKKGKK